MANVVRISPAQLPDGSQPVINFYDSSFFKFNGSVAELPSPAEVKSRSTEYGRSPKPRPVRFEHLNLIVKFGPYVKVAEAQCLWIIKRTLGDNVPVPEIFGWRKDGKDVFIYMQLLPGYVLKDRWEFLTVLEKSAICDQLRQILRRLREVEQQPDDKFIALPDVVFEDQPQAGPFLSITSFNDWFSMLPQVDLPDSGKYADPYRSLMPDSGKITLTHGDLHRSNILISLSGPSRVVTILDWEQAGWYSDYWEYCKACYTAMYSGEWRLEWIPRFLQTRFQEHEVFIEYTRAIGAF